MSEVLKPRGGLLMHLQGVEAKRSGPVGVFFIERDCHLFSGHSEVFEVFSLNVTATLGSVRGICFRKRDGLHPYVRKACIRGLVAPWGSFDSLARRRSQAKWPRGDLLIERDCHLLSGQSEVLNFL